MHHGARAWKKWGKAKKRKSKGSYTKSTYTHDELNARLDELRRVR